MTTILKVFRKLFTRKLSDFQVCTNCKENLRKHCSSRCERCTEYFHKHGKNYVPRKKHAKSVVKVGQGEQEQIQEDNNLGAKDLQDQQTTILTTGETSGK